MGRALPKEPCKHCKGNINKGQSITECKKCNVAIHTKCVKKSCFELVNEKWYCENCSITIVCIYNPFRNLNGPVINSESESHDSDKHFNNNTEDTFDELKVFCENFCGD